MKIVGAKITRINSQRNPEFSGNISLKTNVQINSLEKIKESKDTNKLSYDFDVDYADLGSIKVSGLIFYTADTKTQKELLKQWDNKKLDSPEFIALTNVVMQKASIKAIQLEEELGLPIHVKLPTLSLKK